jgi:hypothetical protein
MMRVEEGAQMLQAVGERQRPARRRRRDIVAILPPQKKTTNDEREIYVCEKRKQTIRNKQKNAQTQTKTIKRNTQQTLKRKRDTNLFARAASDGSSAAADDVARRRDSAHQRAQSPRSRPDVATLARSTARVDCNVTARKKLY